jgi:hypothetical protein
MNYKGKSRKNQLKSTEFPFKINEMYANQVRGEK